MKRLNPLPLRNKEGEIVKPEWRSQIATVLVLLHDAHCLACRKTCQTFTDLKEQFEEWDAKLLLVWRGNFVPEGCEGFLETSSKTRLDWLGENSAGILIVDRHGVVVRQWNALEGFPPPEKILAELKHIALQCPE